MERMISPLFVWQLEFEAKTGLEHAFQSLMQADDLDDCSVEPEDLMIRFTADIPHGQRLVATIYEMGELRWCSRHELQPGPSADRARDGAP
jgi:hypothetical protein